MLCHAYSCDFAQSCGRIHAKTCPNEALICLRSFSTAGRLDPSQRIFWWASPRTAHHEWDSIMVNYTRNVLGQVFRSTLVLVDSSIASALASICLRWLLCYWNVLKLNLIWNSFQYVPVITYPTHAMSIKKAGIRYWNVLKLNLIWNSFQYVPVITYPTHAMSIKKAGIKPWRRCGCVDHWCHDWRKHVFNLGLW